MKTTLDFIKYLYNSPEFVPLHEPRFVGNEKNYLNECIDSTFVSSVGKFVDRFEEEFAHLVGAKYAVSTVNGTAALHVSLILKGVERVDGSRILLIQEKPVQKFFVSAGIYMLNPETLSLIPHNEFYDMPTLFETLIKEEKENIYAYVMDRKSSVDIDDEIDFKMAELYQ